MRNLDGGYRTWLAGTRSAAAGAGARGPLSGSGVGAPAEQHDRVERRPVGTLDVAGAQLRQLDVDGSSAADAMMSSGSSRIVGSCGPPTPAVRLRTACTTTSTTPLTAVARTAAARASPHWVRGRCRYEISTRS